MFYRIKMESIDKKHYSNDLGFLKELDFKI